MHICIPDTVEVRPPTGGGAYVLYNIHIDGLYHCSLRFKQLLHLHQTLSKNFNGPNHHQLPSFPPKKLLPLSANQMEERRTQLEKYLQIISQDKAIYNSSIFNLFLLEAQRESTRIRESQVHLDVELVNGQKIRLHIVTHDSADAILTAVCRALGLDDKYHAYFCLCLCGYDVVRDKLIIKRRLSFFEAPFITLQMAVQQQEQLQNVLSQQQWQSQQNSTIVSVVGSSSGAFVDDNQHGHYNQKNNNNNHTSNARNTITNGNYYLQSLASSSSSFSSRPFVTHRILLRKSYWDPIYDKYLFNDTQALNLLFIQTVYDIKHSLMFVERDTYYELESLLASDSKLEYILLARTLKYYNYVHFEPCYSDYPRPRTKVMISIGCKELSMRVLKSPSNTISIADRNNHQQPGSSYSLNNPTTIASNNPDEPILYCTSSLVPNGCHLTKDDIIEEEYKFKVPLIRCWRLTSLETLNCHDGNGGTCSSYRNRRSSTTPATTTLAGGRRKSLSLFNSVVGISTNGNSNNNNPNNNNSNHCIQPYQTATTTTTIDKTINNNNNRENPYSGSVSISSFGSNNSHISGTDGASLLSALSGSTSFFRCQRPTSNSHQSHVTSCNTSTNSSINHQYCQHENQRCEPSAQHQQPTKFSQYELSFEYLFSKDTLKWITISSDQAIFISISLQGVVDELVSKRDSGTSLLDSTCDTSYHQSQMLSPQFSLGTRDDINNNNQINLDQSSKLRASPEKFTYLYRNGSQKQLSTSNQQLIDKFGTTLGYSPMSPNTLAKSYECQKKRASYPSSSKKVPVSSTSGSIASTFWGRTEILSPDRGIGTCPPSALEIKNVKMAPSPIINHAFEGVATYDDDL